jgi:hypothetical protein
MKTRSEAWAWYEATRNNLRRMKRLGEKHWNDKSLENASIWLDEQFKAIEADDVTQETTDALKPLEDLAILVLFSVFEAAVRDYIEAIVQPEANKLNDPILQDAAADAIEGVREGSFSRRILKPLQDQSRITPELSDKVNQVRDYRNWIAHGKRTTSRKRKVNALSPLETFKRLKEFLDQLGITVEPELTSEEGEEEGEFS